jgi:hypothetical protein
MSLGKDNAMSVGSVGSASKKLTGGSKPSSFMASKSMSNKAQTSSLTKKSQNSASPNALFLKEGKSVLDEIPELAENNRESFTSETEEKDKVVPLIELINSKDLEDINADEVKKKKKSFLDGCEYDLFEPAKLYKSLKKYSKSKVNINQETV